MNEGHNDSTEALNDDVMLKPTRTRKDLSVRSPGTPPATSPAGTSSCWRRWCGSACRSRSRCISRSDCCCRSGLSSRSRWPERRKHNDTQETHETHEEGLHWEQLVQKYMTHTTHTHIIYIYIHIYIPTHEIYIYNIYINYNVYYKYITRCIYIYYMCIYYIYNIIYRH